MQVEWCVHSPGREILGWQRSACTGRQGRRGLVLYRSAPVLVSVTVPLGCAGLLRWLGRREGGCTHEHMSGVNRNTHISSLSSYQQNGCIYTSTIHIISPDQLVSQATPECRVQGTWINCETTAQMTLASESQLSLGMGPC